MLAGSGLELPSSPASLEGGPANGPGQIWPTSINSPATPPNLDTSDVVDVPG